MIDWIPKRSFIGWKFDERVNRRGAWFLLEATGARYVCHYEQDLPCKVCKESTRRLAIKNG